MVQLALTVLLLATPPNGRWIGQGDGLGDSEPGGGYQLTHTMAEIVGPEMAGEVAGMLPPDEPITWEVVLPDNESDEAPGLLVYISPSQSGRLHPDWVEVLAERNLIWVAANDSGNEVAAGRRALYALVAPDLIARYHLLNRERIWLTGFSGGSRVASRVAIDYPRIFRGALYSGGVDFWDGRRPKDLEQVRSNSFVFMAGSEDFALRQTKKVHQRYLEAGVERAELFVVEGLEHRYPSGEDFARALDLLETSHPD